MRAAPVRGALSHGDLQELRLLKFFLIIIIIIIIITTHTLLLKGKQTVSDETVPTTHTTLATRYSNWPWAPFGDRRGRDEPQPVFTELEPGGKVQRGVQK